MIRKYRFSSSTACLARVTEEKQTLTKNMTTWKPVVKSRLHFEYQCFLSMTFKSLLKKEKNTIHRFLKVQVKKKVLQEIRFTMGRVD